VCQSTVSMRGQSRDQARLLVAHGVVVITERIIWQACRLTIANRQEQAKAMVANGVSRRQVDEAVER